MLFPAGGVFLVPQLCMWHPLKQQAFIMSKLVHQVLHYVNQLLLAQELQPKLVRAPHRLVLICHLRCMHAGLCGLRCHPTTVISTHQVLCYLNQLLLAHKLQPKLVRTPHRPIIFRLRLLLC